MTIFFGIVHFSFKLHCYGFHWALFGADSAAFAVNQIDIGCALLGQFDCAFGAE